jgi:metal-responsive CopG/Arc/MetJ family transcriptional regulator
MKTAISLPDTLYEDAEKTAKSMGIPRSQLFAKALEEFISNHNKENITEKYNQVYSQITSNDISKIESVSILNLRELTKNDTW